MLNQLNNGGYLLAPVGPPDSNQFLELYQNKGDGNIVKKRLLGVRFVPLTDKEKQINKVTTGSASEACEYTYMCMCVGMTNEELFHRELEAKGRRIKRLELEMNIKEQTHRQEMDDIRTKLELAHVNNEMTENRLQEEINNINQSLEQLQQTERNLRANLQAKERNWRQEVSEKEQTVRDLHDRLAQSIDSLNNTKTSTQCHWILSSQEIIMTQEVLGKGGWGEVKVAYFRGLKVAAKRLHKIIISDYSLSVFVREMEMATRIRHHNLLQFIGATQPQQDHPVIIMKLMSASLRKELDKSQLNRAQMLKISKDVATALNYLHLWKPHPMIHQDVSSSNVLLEPYNCPGQWKAKLSDFGLANLVHRISRTACPSCPAYSAPDHSFLIIIHQAWMCIVLVYF